MQTREGACLVTVATNDHLVHTKQLFASASFVGGWRGDFAIIKHGRSPEDAWFTDRGVFVHYASAFDHRASPRQNLLLSKLEMFRDTFGRWKKLLYLDTDVIVRGSLAGALRFGGIAAVQGFTWPLQRDRLRKPDWFERDARRRYRELARRYGVDGYGVNGGVYVVDTSVIQPDLFTSLTTFHARYRDILRFADEGVVSTFFKDALVSLPPCYNMGVDWYGLRDPDRDDGIVLHFVGPMKPWNPGCPYHGEYLRNLALADDLGRRPAEELAPLDAIEEKACEERLAAHHRRGRRRYYVRSAFRRGRNALLSTARLLVFVGKGSLFRATGL